MASTRAAVLFYSFLVLLACCSPLAQARESQFFSKTTRYDGASNSKTTSPAKEEMTSYKEDTTFQYKPDDGNGYGLYGHDGAKDLPHANPASYDTEENYEAAGSTTSRSSNGEFRGVNYESKEFTDADYPNRKPTDYDAGNKKPSRRYPPYANEREQFGMSDTRFLENGKYFYDLNAEESYKNVREYKPSKPYESSGEREISGNGGYTFANGNGYDERNTFQEENQPGYAP